ncbi:hypothetical protein MSG28_009663 [Choristoneura fumiferana]|uniref:Uncharacterized protein n=1 Tax=Choristoneura fumiferana TaxID=7141 RepID=A0ACC0JBZ8_CHOFU|nr:hypothetical protein MSG28_009663 [Choristoneura fumiferana]
MTSEALSNDQIFLASCEELLKDRYTEKDEEYMKVFNAEPSMPPIVESWWVSNSRGRRNDRRPYGRRGHDNRGHDHRRGYDNRNYGHQSNRPRY